MRRNLLIFIAIFISNSAIAEPDLITQMARLQYFTHKLSLAVVANNLPLAQFYGHELEEVIHQVSQVESYKDYPVGEMAKTTLYPQFLKLESALKREDISHAPRLLGQMIDSCNSCHDMTEHEFIVIGKQAEGGYLQVFAP